PIPGTPTFVRAPRRERLPHDLTPSSLQDHAVQVLRPPLNGIALLAELRPHEARLVDLGHPRLRGDRMIEHTVHYLTVDSDLRHAGSDGSSNVSHLEPDAGTVLDARCSATHATHRLVAFRAWEHVVRFSGERQNGVENLESPR